MSLPIYQTASKDLSLLQTTWATQLNPLLAQPMSNGHLLQQVTLINGITQVNHGLQRKLQGWFIVRQRSAASVYDQQDSNSMPTLTLTLVSSALVVVDLFVF